MNVNKSLIAVALGLVVAACAPANGQRVPTVEEARAMAERNANLAESPDFVRDTVTADHTELQVVEDQKRGIVCYLYVASYNGRPALSCVPMKSY